VIINCPSCNTEYNCEPGKYECECGAKFSLSEEGLLSLNESFSSDTAVGEPPIELDFDKTILPKQYEEEVEADLDKTMPGKRERKPDGRFGTGDLILGRYSVLSELGQGGMGVVYKCFDEIAGIVIALKALPPELSHNTMEMEEVKENFQLVSRLVHQNIAISKNLERDNSTGNYYLIMECVEGEDLRHWIKWKRSENALTVETILPVIRQVAEALDYAHEQRIIHRDIKPGNIMIDAEGNVKVLDFGLAAQIHTSMTRVSMAYHGTSGTAPYMAPEQWRGRAQGAPADQYALAVMTYEMLAGHLPFESTDASVLREAVLNETAEPLQGVPAHAQKALNRAMSKNPADRFSSCSDFVATLGGLSISDTHRNQEKTSSNISSREYMADRDAAIKRISILMEQQEWEKAREYCEHILEFEPEDAELYLLLCMIDNRICEEDGLEKVNFNLQEDKNFQVAMRFALPERKQKLQRILDEQSKLFQETDCASELFLQQCMKYNHVSNVSQLPYVKVPLSESSAFQNALKCASPNRKKELQRIQEEQEKILKKRSLKWFIITVIIGIVIFALMLNCFIDCKHCSGTGSVNCYQCNGKGETPGLLWGTNTCSKCGGSGKIKCSYCNGTGRD